MGDEALLPRPVTVVHPSDLRQTHVGLIHDDEVLLRVSMELIGARSEEVEQAVRALARLPAVKVERIVLHRLTVPDFAKHFEVVLGFLLQTVALEFLALLGKPLAALVEFFLDGFQGRLEPLGAGHEEFLRVDPRFFKRVKRLP